jgi:hypothetical protein
MSTVRGINKTPYKPDRLKVPFPLPVVEAKKRKKKCCKKYKKGKRCKGCPDD